MVKQRGFVNIPVCENSPSDSTSGATYDPGSWYISLDPVPRTIDFLQGGRFFHSIKADYFEDKKQTMLPKLLGQVFMIGLQIAGKLAIETFKKNLVGGSASISAIKRPATISIEEACKILNISKGAPQSQVDSQYLKLFSANDPKAGGSLYLQSKILRAYEALVKNKENKISDSW